MRYEKKPLTVQAEAFVEPTGPGDQMPFISAENPPRYRYDGKWKIKTAEGWMWIKSGDWVLLNELDNRYYLRSDNDFKRNYRELQ